MYKQSKMSKLSEECKSYIKGLTNLKKEQKPKKLSAYNIFSQEARAKVEGTPKEIMTKLGALWKASTEKQKEAYKKKTVKVNAELLKEFEANKQEGDPQTLELKALIEETIKKFKKDLTKTVKKKDVETVVETVVAEA